MRYLSIVLTLFVMTSCGDDHDHDHNGHSHETNTYNSHGCGHLEYGPFEAIVPSDDAANGTSLAYMTNGQVSMEADAFGYIALQAVSDGNYAVFTSGPAVMLEDADGNTIEPTYTAESVPDCTLVGFKAMYALTTQTYALRVGPYAEATDLSVIFVHPDAARTDD